MNSPAMDRAESAVPEIAAFDARREELQARLAALPPATDPDAAMCAVLDDVDDLTPAVEKRAADAYTTALVRSAMARRVAAKLSAHGAHERRALLRHHKEDLLAALDTQLQELLTKAQKDIPDLGTARTADEAVTAGDRAVGAYTHLRDLLAGLQDVRAAAWHVLCRDVITGPAAPISHARRAGFTHVRGLTPDGIPARQLDVMAAPTFEPDLDHLVWLASTDAAYVPASTEEAVEAWKAWEAARQLQKPVSDMTPTVIPVPPAKQPDVPAHARAPHLSYDQAPGKVVPVGGRTDDEGLG